MYNIILQTTLNYFFRLEDSKYWEKDVPKEVKGPALFKSSFYINRAPYDCILHIEVSLCEFLLQRGPLMF